MACLWCGCAEDERRAAVTALGTSTDGTIGSSQSSQPRGCYRCDGYGESVTGAFNGGGDGALRYLRQRAISGRGDGARGSTGGRAAS